MWSGESHGSNVSNTNNNNGMDVCNDFVISSDTNDESDARDECTNDKCINLFPIPWNECEYINHWFQMDALALRFASGLTAHRRMMELLLD